MSSTSPNAFPRVLSIRERAAVVNRLLARRLGEVLPAAMRAAEIDCWLILCHEDNLDPVLTTMIPMESWTPILQMLVFFDRGDGIERINLSATNTHGLYDRPYRGQHEPDQWAHLIRLIEERDPRQIGLNIGATQWAAGGLTYNLHRQLIDRLPARLHDRLFSAEAAVIHWSTTLTPDDIAVYEHVCAVAHAIIARCYRRASIVPGVTTIDELPWVYWQRCADLGFTMAFTPTFRLFRSPANRARSAADDPIIRPGDLLHCDVGFQYLRFNSDHQHLAYILSPGEIDAPAGLRRLLAEAGRLQDIYLSSFQTGLTGNDLLARVLDRARAAGIPTPKVYSHSVGLFLHEPGPLIGLPWEQTGVPGRGDVRLFPHTCFTMELSVQGPVAEWDNEEVRLPVEEVVWFDGAVCRPLDGRQTAFHLV